MKKINFLLFLPGIILTIVLLGCGKGEKVNPSPPAISPPNPPLPAKITPPKVEAGFNQFVFLPLTQTKLNGYVESISPANKIEWKKITGSDKCIIDSPYILRPALLNLEKGTFQFELTATDPNGLKDKDTVTITVVDAAGEYRIPKLIWLCPMDCSLATELKISETKPFKLFIKTLAGIYWFEVVNINTAASPYYYELNNNTLVVYTSDDRGTSELKIVF